MTGHRPPWARLRPWQRHSLVLAVAGAVYVAVGLVYLLTPTTPNRAAGQRFLTDWYLFDITVPFEFYGVLWVIVGALALASTRWPPSSKTWGYTALTALSALWGSGYLLSVLARDAPSSQLSGAFVWGLVAFMWWAIAGLANPDDLLPPPREATADEEA